MEVWKSSISREVFLKIQENRSVLVLCESIRDAEILHRRLQLDHSTDHVSFLLYRRGFDMLPYTTDKNKLPPRTIITATNLAGRGTDLKISDELKNKGLHVILTYLPANARIRDQGYGRACRAGNPGSGQLIMLGKTEGSGELVNPFDSMILKDEIERRRVRKVRDYYKNVTYQEEANLEKFILTNSCLRLKMDESIDKSTVHLHNGSSQWINVIYKEVMSSLKNSDWVVVACEDEYISGFIGPNLGLDRGVSICKFSDLQDQKLPKYAEDRHVVIVNKFYQAFQFPEKFWVPLLMFANLANLRETSPFFAPKTSDFVLILSTSADKVFQSTLVYMINETVGNFKLEFDTKNPTKDIYLKFRDSYTNLQDACVNKNQKEEEGEDVTSDDLGLMFGRASKRKDLIKLSLLNEWAFWLDKRQTLLKKFDLLPQQLTPELKKQEDFITETFPDAQFIFSETLLTCVDSTELENAALELITEPTLLVKVAIDYLKEKDSENAIKFLEKVDEIEGDSGSQLFRIIALYYKLFCELQNICKEEKSVKLDKLEELRNKVRDVMSQLQKLAFSQLQIPPAATNLRSSNFQQISRFDSLRVQKLITGMCLLILRQSLECTVGKEGVDETDFLDIVDGNQERAKEIFDTFCEHGIITCGKVKSASSENITNMEQCLQILAAKYGLSCANIKNYLVEHEGKFLKKTKEDVDVSTEARSNFLKTFDQKKDSIKNKNLYEEFILDATQLGFIEKTRVAPLADETILEKAMSKLKGVWRQVKHAYGHYAKLPEIERIQERINLLRGSILTEDTPSVSLVSLQDIFEPSIFSYSVTETDFELEVIRFQMLGMDNLIHGAEKKYQRTMKIYALFSMAAGIVQLVIGVIKLTFPFGMVNLPLMQGLRDIGYGLQAFKQGTFSWSDYIKGKVLSAGIGGVSQLWYCNLITPLFSSRKTSKGTNQLQTDMNQLSLSNQPEVVGHLEELVTRIVKFVNVSFSSQISSTVGTSGRTLIPVITQLNMIDHRRRTEVVQESLKQTTQEMLEESKMTTLIDKIADEIVRNVIDPTFDVLQFLLSNAEEKGDNYVESATNPVLGFETFQVNLSALVDTFCEEITAKVRNFIEELAKEGEQSSAENADYMKWTEKSTSTMDSLFEECSNIVSSGVIENLIRLLPKLLMAHVISKTDTLVSFESSGFDDADQVDESSGGVHINSKIGEAKALLQAEWLALPIPGEPTYQKQVHKPVTA